jgi:hypothetical protein
MRVSSVLRESFVAKNLLRTETSLNLKCSHDTKKSMKSEILFCLSRSLLLFTFHAISEPHETFFHVSACRHEGNFFPIIDFSFVARGETINIERRRRCERAKYEIQREKIIFMVKDKGREKKVVAAFGCSIEPKILSCEFDDEIVVWHVNEGIFWQCVMRLKVECG